MGIDSLESIPGLLKHLQILAPACQGISWRIKFLGSILGLSKSFKIPPLFVFPFVFFRSDLSFFWNKPSSLRFDLFKFMNKQSSIRIDLSFVWNKQSSLRFNHSYIFASIFLKGV